jgi:hypothetical protein
MPDNNKDQFDLESDYNFDAITDFESDSKGPKTASSDAPDFGEFGTSTEPDFGTFDGGAEFEGSTDNVDFGSQEFEPTEDFGGGGGDVDFDFGGPPSPQSVELESLSGNPDEEFGDFTGNDGFGTTLASDPFGDDDDDAAPAGKAAHDPFSDDDDDHNAGTGVEDDGAEAASSKGGSKPGIKYYAGVAAAVAVVGFIGYTQVLPMFLPQDSAPVVAEAPSVLQNGPVSANLPPIAIAVQQPQQPAAIPAVPVVDPVDGMASAGTPPLALPGATPAATDNPIAIGAPAAIDNPVVAEAKPSLALPAVGQPAAQAPAKIDPLDEMVGGSDRGGLSSMKGDTDEAPAKTAAPIANADIAALASRLDEVVKRIDAVEQRVASFGATFGGNTVAKAPGSAETPVTRPAGVDGDVTAPLKPPIIENAVLRGVSRDIAWIATGKDVVEVKVGDTVADAGVVESFQNYRGRWIAVTDKGIILPR